MDYFTKHTLSTLMMAIFSGITVTTSAAGIIKVAGSMNGYKPNVPEVKTVQAALQEEANLLRSNEKKSEILSPTPTVNTDINSCIITLFAKQYDVATLRSDHPGGDVFICGTDQTAIYQEQHGTDVSRMQPYLVTNNNQSEINGSSSSNPVIEIDNETDIDHEDQDSNHQDKSENNRHPSNDNINRRKQND